MLIVVRRLSWNNVRRRMSVVHQSTFKGYLQFIIDDESEMHQFISAITIHTTSWFREAEHFKYLQTKIEERIKASTGKLQFKLLSAGCSTGQEVYTIALICEDLRLKHDRFDYEIIGLDVDPISLAHARRGEYHSVRSRLFLMSFKNLS